MRTACLLTALSAALLLPATPALAGNLSLDSATGLLVYAYSAREAFSAHEVTLTMVGGDLRISDAAAFMNVGSGCTADPPHAALCPAADVAQVAVVFGDAADRFSNDTAVSSVACGGGGSDTLVGGEGRDIFAGGDGRDELSGRGGPDLLAIALPGLCDGGAGAWGGEVLDGGAGKDVLYGGPGADVIGGDDGDDSLYGYAGDDRLSGGA